MNELDNNFAFQSHQNVPHCFSSFMRTLMLCLFQDGFVDNEHFHCGELILTEISDLASSELPLSSPHLILTGNTYEKCQESAQLPTSTGKFQIHKKAQMPVVAIWKNI